MLFRTNSIGVRRLSLILGIIAGCFIMLTQHTPITSGENRISWNLLNMALLFAAGFIAAWGTVHVIAWIIVGFILDRSNKS